MKSLSICLMLFISIRTSVSSHCYWNSGCTYKYFGSKTPYSYIRGDIRDSIIHLKGCQPVSIWGVYRHGKRYPSKKFATVMKSVLSLQNYVGARYAVGESSLCAQDVDNLIQWEPDINLLNNHGQIAEEGLREMEELGKRIKQAFPKQLGNLKEGEYNFQSTYGLRIEKSTEAFIKGFKTKNLTYQKSEASYHIAAPYQTCKQYQIELEDEDTLYAEPINFYNNPEWLAMKDRIQRRTGVTNLTDDNIRATYDICRYNSSGIHNHISPWCALFTTEDLLVLEYESDLRHYYRHGYGYGHHDTEIFGRVTLTDLLDKFKQAKSGGGPKISAYITHATTLDTMYMALGLFFDEEPLTSGYRDPNRKWRTAKQSTFSSNFMAVLNRCPDNNASEYNVVFYVNEEPLMSICKHGVCTWKEFEEKLTFQNTSLDFCGGLSVPFL